jgi:hypothetical protein
MISASKNVLITSDDFILILLCDVARGKALPQQIIVCCEDSTHSAAAGAVTIDTHVRQRLAQEKAWSD